MNLIPVFYPILVRVAGSGVNLSLGKRQTAFSKSARRDSDPSGHNEYGQWYRKWMNGQMNPLKIYRKITTLKSMTALFASVQKLCNCAPEPVDLYQGVVPSDYFVIVRVYPWRWARRSENLAAESRPSVLPAQTTTKYNFGLAWMCLLIPIYSSTALHSICIQWILICPELCWFYTLIYGS